MAGFQDKNVGLGNKQLVCSTLNSPPGSGEYKQWEEVGRKSRINSSC